MKLVMDLPQRTPGRTVIAHISDLHFEADTKPDEWILQALNNSLAPTKPDLLFVTGDLIDSSLGDNLERCRSNCAHEVARIRGIALQRPGSRSAKVTLCCAGQPRLSDKRAVFDKEPAGMVAKEFGQYFDFAAIPGLNTVVFTFDSNSTDPGLNLASGLIVRERFTEFEANVSSARSNTQCNWYDCTKIALLHHHPMPIGPTEHRLNIADRNRFLLLKNTRLHATDGA